MTPLIGTLTVREETVLDLLAQGHGLREIAAIMGCSQGTARVFRDSARKKLGASTQTEAVAKLIRARAGG